MLLQKDVLICKGGSFSGIILYLVAAEVDCTDAPKNESITMSLQNAEELYNYEDRTKCICPHREYESQTLINCLNYTHFYSKPMNCLET